MDETCFFDAFRSLRSTEGLALELFKSVPYGKRAILVAKQKSLGEKMDFWLVSELLHAFTIDYSLVLERKLGFKTACDAQGCGRALFEGLWMTLGIDAGFKGQRLDIHLPQSFQNPY